MQQQHNLGGQMHQQTGVAVASQQSNQQNLVVITTSSPHQTAKSGTATVQSQQQQLQHMQMNQPNAAFIYTTASTANQSGQQTTSVQQQQQPILMNSVNSSGLVATQNKVRPFPIFNHDETKQNKNQVVGSFISSIWSDLYWVKLCDSGPVVFDDISSHLSTFWEANMLCYVMDESCAYF